MERTALDICRQARKTGLAGDWRGAPALGALLAGGPDAVAFLQSQLTSDVHALGAGQGQASARLTRTGALVGAFHLFRLPEQGQPFPTFLMILPSADIVTLQKDLQTHLLADDVVLEDVTGAFAGWIVQGPAAANAMDAALGSKTAPPPGFLVLEFPATGDPGWLILYRGAGDDVTNRLTDAATHADLAWLDDDRNGRTAWDWLRVEAGWPLAGRDYEPGKLPLPQTGLEQQVVSTTKGCYLGQEVVARIRTYGSVPRALRGLVFTDWTRPSLPAFPIGGEDLVTADGTKIGRWASGALSAEWKAPVALAYLDRERRTPGRMLTVDVAGERLAARVVLLPFYQAGDAAARARSLHDRAVHLFSQGDDDQAARLLEASLRLDPQFTDAYEALGVMLGRAERYHEAIDIFRRLEDVAPDEPLVHTNLSLFYMKIGDKDEAERQRALATAKRFGVTAVDPETAGRQAVETDRARRAEAERKRDMFAEVLRIDSDDALALMGLGNALAELGEFAAARENLVRACEIQRDNSPLYAALGRVLEQLGRTEEAAATYRRGVEVASRRGDFMPLKEMEHRLLMLEATE